MATHNDLVGLTVVFSKNKRVNIKKRCSNRGHNCVSYIGELIITENGEEVNKGRFLVKEFAPENFDTIIIDVEDTFVSRKVLAEQWKKFKPAYDMFFENVKKTESVIDEICKSDPYLSEYIEKIPADYDKCRLFGAYDDDPAYDDYTYSGLMLYPYRSSDASEKIGNMNLEEKLNFLVMLCKILDKFHSNGFAILDLKPENFTYYQDLDRQYIRLFDFDSMLAINKNDKKGCIYTKDENKVCGTSFFSAPEVLSKHGKYESGKLSDTYSIGSILLYYFFYDIFDEIVPSKNNFKTKDLDTILSNSTYERVREKCDNISIGFWRKFTKIIKKSMSKYLRERDFGGDGSIVYLADEINTLLDIYRHKGVHPEVILDSAKKLSNSNDFKLSDFNKDLLCEVEEVND